MKPATQVSHKPPRPGEGALSAGEARVLDSLDDRGQQNTKALIATTGLNEEQVKRVTASLFKAETITRKMTRGGYVWCRPETPC